MRERQGSGAPLRRLGGAETPCLCFDESLFAPGAGRQVGTWGFVASFSVQLVAIRRSARGPQPARPAQAAFAMAATRSQVVAWKLLRAVMRASQSGRFGRSAVNCDHSGVCDMKSMCEATRMSASDTWAPAR